MDEIRPWLYIGKYRDTLDKNYLDFKFIKAMLQLADPVEQKGINSLFLPVEDLGPTSPALIKQGVDFILAEKEKGYKVLVACGAGINRSTCLLHRSAQRSGRIKSVGCLQGNKENTPRVHAA